LVGRQEGHPTCKKTEWWGGGLVICLEQGADLHTAQLMPLPRVCVCVPYLPIKQLKRRRHQSFRKLQLQDGRLPELLLA